MARATTGEMHVSSAIVFVMPGREDAVAEAAAGMAGVELHASVPGRLVVVIEGASSGEVGTRLLALAVLPDVVAANLVYEQVEPIEESGEDHV